MFDDRFFRKLNECLHEVTPEMGARVLGITHRMSALMAGVGPEFWANPGGDSGVSVNVKVERYDRDTVERDDMAVGGVAIEFKATNLTMTVAVRPDGTHVVATFSSGPVEHERSIAEGVKHSPDKIGGFGPYCGGSR